MEDEDRPVFPGGARIAGSSVDAASLLASESLDRYSLDELAQRIAALEAEIARVRAHRDKAAAHRSAADALFGRGKAPAGEDT